MTQIRPTPIGISLLALMVGLVGSLALMLSISLLLRTGLSARMTEEAVLIAGLSVAGFGYLVLARGLWQLKRWTRNLALFLLPALTIAGLLDSMGNDVMALSTMLVFALGFVTNLVVILAMHREATRTLFVK